MAVGAAADGWRRSRVINAKRIGLSRAGGGGVAGDFARWRYAGSDLNTKRLPRKREVGAAAEGRRRAPRAGGRWALLLMVGDVRPVPVGGGRCC